MNAPAHRYSPLKRAGRVIEKFVRHRTTALLARITAQPRQSPPDWDARAWRVLFLRHDRIGDMIVSTGLLTAIHRAHPGLALDVLASPINAIVLAHEPAVRAVVRFDRRSLASWWTLFWRLRRERYDAVIDPMVTSQSFTTLLLMLATGARWRVGVPKERLPDVYALPATARSGTEGHLVDYLAQLAEPFGIAPADATTLRISLTDAERAAALITWGAGRRILVNVSAGKPFRAWPSARYAETIRHMRAQVPDARVLVMYAPAEAEIARSIAEASGAVAFPSTLREGFAMVATAEFVLTPDTSIVHAASAFRVPTVSLFTADMAIRWHLYRNPGEDVVTNGWTLADLPTATVVAAVDRVLATAGLLPASAAHG